MSPEDECRINDERRTGTCMDCEDSDYGECLACFFIRILDAERVKVGELEKQLAEERKAREEADEAVWNMHPWCRRILQAHPFTIFINSPYGIGHDPCPICRRFHERKSKEAGDQ